MYVQDQVDIVEYYMMIPQKIIFYNITLAMSSTAATNGCGNVFIYIHILIVDEKFNMDLWQWHGLQDICP